MDTSELRRSYLEILTPILGIPGFDTSIPIDISPLPNAYFLVSDVTRTPTQYGKGTLANVTAFRESENRVFMNVDICVINGLGFHSSLSVENLIDISIERVTTLLNPNGYYVKETKVVNVVPLHLVTDTQNIQRKVVAFEHWISKK
ncbi:MAG: hypothetical protein LBF27_25820 [Sphingobacterium sp.]|jgi:hypothetical protein|nr:hypothetical protein [Sphingobacterium sp.]